MKYTKRKTTRGKPKAFAKAVMNVVNKKSELKQTTTQNSLTSIAAGAFQTYNICRPDLGVNSSQRVGNKIFIKSIRISARLTNSSPAGSVNAIDGEFRLMIFKGKYDYSATNYPPGEVFEGNAGASPNNFFLSRVDKNQVWPLLDKSILVKQQATNIVSGTYYQRVLPVNRSYTIREDDTFGGFTNLYLGILYDNPIGGITTGCQQFQITVEYTDV